ncbi:hypothetical protein EOD41_13880 [Mucilaginibacter limnophilus]|uniref:Uncharacterized protein n=1 Tax=Mucilaginibacter limnophilus TaxID=1932778 RepID=A0A437MQZ1_9SPHI|nr:hypothetical protein [Mucilaginibacter limnophilus]RVU00046.1 hypothetical protein EOD41_13880 [Mucilaginibacter limnophilus]
MANLKQKVLAIEVQIKQLVKQYCTENYWITHYGSFDIHPKHLVYWICVKSDKMKASLEQNTILNEQLRFVLRDNDYPEEGINHVHIGFESQETVDRESDGNWWFHWK